MLYKDSTQVFLQPAGHAAITWEPQYYTPDFDLASKMGMNAFRIGIEWSQIEPEKDQWCQEAIDHYKKMIRSMREKGLRPVITLNHLILPLWVLTPPSDFTKKLGQGILPSPEGFTPVGSASFRSILEISEDGRIIRRSKNLLNMWR
jgi:beta-galactosidase GanA